MNNNEETNGTGKFNPKAGCIGMIAIMIGVLLLTWGIILMVGIDPEKSLRAIGFVMFMTGASGLLSFLIFSTHADGIANFIKQFKRQ